MPPITTRKVKVRSSAGATPPPDLCPVLALGPAGPENNATTVYNQNNYVTTNIVAGQSDSSGVDLTNVYSLDGGLTVVFAATINSLSQLNDQGAIGIIAVDALGFSVFQGVVLELGTGVDGIIRFVGSPGAQLSGLTFPTLPYTMQIEVNEDGSAVFSDEDATGPLRTGLAVPTEGAFTGLSVGSGSLSGAPFTAGASIDITMNGGSSVMTLPLVNPAALTWCNLPIAPPLVPEYKFFETAPFPVTVSLGPPDDRAINLISDGVVAADFQAAAGWGQIVPDSVKNPNGNTFEFIMTQQTSDDFSIFFSPFNIDNLEAAFLAILNFTNGWLLQLMGSSQATVGFSFGDIFAVQIWDDGANPSEIGFIYKPLGGNPIIFDRVILGAGTNEQWSVLLQQVISNVEAIGKDAGILFNGKDSDYVFDEYPIGSLEYDNVNPLPVGKTAVHTRVSAWHDYPYNPTSFPLTHTAVLSNGNKTITFDNTDLSQSYLTARTSCAAGAQANSGVVAVMMEISTASASGDSEKLELLGVGIDNNSKEIGIEIDNFGAMNLVTPVGDFVIRAVASYSDGDVLCIVKDTVGDNFRGYHYNGATVAKCSNANVGGADARPLSIPASGIEQMPFGESCVLENLYSAADMTSAGALAIKAEILIDWGVSGVDILGVSL